MIRRLRDKALWRLFPIFERVGIHVLPIRFDTPIPDTRELASQLGRFTARHPMTGVVIDLERQLAFVERCIQPWDVEYRAAGSTHFGTDESSMTSYAPANALALYAVIREFRPSRMIEVGSGMSSHVAAAAFKANAALGAPGSYTVIDPYAGAAVRGLRPEVTLVEQKVEDIGVDPFLTLRDGDVLFIDSSHTVKAFGDVNFLFLEVIPRLNPGVIIHVHDIFFPREYLPHHFFSPHVKQIWQEQYLLHAFLLFNREFDVLVSLSYLHFEAQERLTQMFPWYHSARCPSSFWMRRIPAS